MSSIGNRGHWKWDKIKQKFIKHVEKRVVVNAPYVITDEMAPTMNYADCKVYDSKRKFRAATKAKGFEEVGTSTQQLTCTRTTDEAIEKYEATVAKAIAAVESGNAPLSEFDKERCKIINKQLENHSDQRVRDRDRTN